MEYKIALSPDLNINSHDFVAMWNSDPKSLYAGKAEEIKYSKDAFSMSPDQALILLQTVAGAIALDLIKDLIKDKIKSIFEKQAPEKPGNISINIINNYEGQIIVVTPDQE